MNKVLHLSCFLLLSILSIAQTQEVQWLTIEEAEVKNKVEPRPFLIDLYTDWCGWCKRLDVTTYRDPQIVTFLNQNFYPVKFDAETKDTVVYRGKTYANRGTGNRSTHDLALEFMPERRSYPTTYFTDATMKRNLIVPGYLKANEMAAFLVFYKEELYNATNINEFRTLFEEAFQPNNPKYNASTNWIHMNEALAKNKTAKKKIIVYLKDKNSASGKVMENTTFKDSLVVDYINRNFIAVNFDIRSQDTISIANQKLINSLTDGNIHQLAIAGMRNGPLKFPSVLFFDENNLLITPVPQYMTPNFMLPVLSYFKEDKYKDTEFAEYLKNYEPEN